MGAPRSYYRQKYPVIYAYGPKQAFLSTDEAIGATVEDRIRSVWPFLVHRVIQFQAGLNATPLALICSERSRGGGRRSRDC